MQVLLVEDNPGDVRLLREMVAEDPFTEWQITHAGSFANAVEHLGASNFDVILLDLSLPDTHGLNTFVRMAALEPAAPVIVLSGLDDTTLALQAVRTGAQDYLLKGEVTSNLITRAMRYAIERKRAEDALKQERSLLAQRVAERTAELSAVNAELTRAAKLKNEFLATISHELRTPLSVILMVTQSLQKGVYGAVTQRQYDSVERIHKSGNHLLALITDLLDLSKIEAGQFSMEVSPVSAHTICQSSLQMVQEAAQGKRIRLSYAQNNAVGTIQADERRLTQILLNLLNNAVKFTPADGQVGLEVTGDRAREFVRFVVWDTGIGINEGDYERIFRPFEQVDHNLNRQYDGAGLGLPLVYRLVELHGGSVTIESALGQGSRFIVTLPWSPPAQNGTTAEPTASAAAIAQATRTGSPLILVADHSAQTLKTIETYLTAHTYRVVTAHTGAQALERASRHQPDLIFMALQMPDMDGLEVIRFLRSHADLKHVPIIALTALILPGERERSLRAGATQYVSKPINAQQVQDLLLATLPTATL
jgi:signal transduction histidine kinase